MYLTLCGLILCAASGLPGLALYKVPGTAQRVGTGLIVCGCACLLAAAVTVLLGQSSANSTLLWQPFGALQLHLDGLGAFFMVPVSIVGAAGSFYALGYRDQRTTSRNNRSHDLFYGLLIAGMALLLVGKHSLAFLLGWESMALSAFFLITTDDQSAECRRAGWIYLISSHVCTLTLFGLFALWNHVTGSWLLTAQTNESLQPQTAAVFFLIALFAFGIKAGMIPLHFWLPGAHSVAPSHISALMSGVVIKMGIFGMLRFFALLPVPPLYWGVLLLALGALSSLLGVVYAIGQHEFKRLLAYHSVENIGIILLGLGVALVGRSSNNPLLIAAGLGGCLLHVWNHAFFKSLLFLCAGSVLHATGLRMLDLMGGVAKTMRWTSGLFLIGAVAICGLPPLNGFVSEFIIYRALAELFMRAGLTGAAAALATVVLAMTGALAVACFVKVYGTVFLGAPRTTGSAPPRESGFTMLASMALLAALCGVIGLFPAQASALLDCAIAAWLPTQTLPSSITIVTLKSIGMFNLVLWVSIATLTLFFRFVRIQRSRALTWDCGYAAPTARMQYSASSFAQSIVTAFAWALRQKVKVSLPQGIFAHRSHLSTHIDDPVLDHLILPTARTSENAAGWFRRFQQGLIQKYLAYIAIAAILILCTLIPFKKVFLALFSR